MVLILFPFLIPKRNNFLLQEIGYLKQTNSFHIIIRPCRYREHFLKELLSIASTNKQVNKILTIFTQTRFRYLSLFEYFKTHITRNVIRELFVSTWFLIFCHNFGKSLRRKPVFFSLPFSPQILVSEDLRTQNSVSEPQCPMAHINAVGKKNKRHLSSYQAIHTTARKAPSRIDRSMSKIK